MPAWIDNFDGRALDRGASPATLLIDCVRVRSP
jgi:hypothetical protein